MRRYWDEFGYVAPLSRDFQVIVPDLRGHGESGTPTNGDFTDAAFASDIVAVLDHLGIGAAHVFGYSLGGWIVFELAATSTSRVRKAIVGGAHPYREDLSFVRSFAPAAILDYWTRLGAPLSDTSRTRIANLNSQRLLEIAQDRQDQSERLTGLAVAFLAICGTNDWRFEEMKRFAGNGERYPFVTPDNLDHLEAWLRSDLIVPAVQGFLQAGS
jgi:pimeloyl-ACP methyl ester carboxylesterase